MPTVRLIIAAGSLLLLAGYAVAQTAQLPPNTINCSGFKKMPDGTWFAAADNRPFDIGAARGVTVTNMAIRPGSLVIKDADLYAALEMKCAGKSN
jgi:hypothetical protein